MKQESPYVPRHIRQHIEHQIIPSWEQLVNHKSVLACTIERMQKNMEDVLNDFPS